MTDKIVNPRPQGAQGEWCVRNALPTEEAKRAYDKYRADYRRRMNQLKRESAGEVEPGDEWYRE